MAQTLTHPKTRLEPTRIAPETFLIHNHHGEGEAPVIVPLNSMVIRAKEPVVVDTGFAEHREQFLEDVFSLVDPEDIRWLYISHDDVDHTGNVNELMRLAPNATLVINWTLSLTLMTLVTATVYYVCPDVDGQPWQWLSPGVVVFIVGFGAASLGFSLWVSRYASYDKTYGSLGAVIAFLVWLFVSNSAIMLGVQLNAEVQREVFTDPPGG